MSSKTAVIINQERLHIVPQLLFQRLILVGTRESQNIEELFKYELCSYLVALFETTDITRPANKAVLADALWKEVKEHQTDSSMSDPLYVLDGGALLHRIP